MAALRIQVHHLGALDGEAAPPQHVHLHRHVGNVLRLEAVGRLHLDHVVAARPARQDVHACIGVIREEPGLIQHRRVVSDGVAGRRHLVVVLVERQVDQLAARDVTAGALVYFGALREAVAERHVGNELRRVGLVHAPPQLFVTLEAGEVAGLGEAVSGGRVGHEANLAASRDSSRAFTAVGRLHRLLMCPLPPSSRSSSSPRCS